MITNYLVLLMVAILLFLVYQDFKTRTIHVILPILVFITAIIINQFSVDLSYTVILQNTLFILINIIALVGYFSFKNKRIVNPVDVQIGLGDIVFFLAITPLFNLKTFILFFIASLFFSLITHTLFTLFKKVETIPLAGYMSLFLIGNFIVKYALKINLHF